MRIADFTGFACTVTATVVEEGGEPERREPEGGTGSQDPAQQDAGSVAHLSPKCAGRQRADCRLELANKPGCYKHNLTYSPLVKLNWSGACAGGVAVGKGTVTWKGGSGYLTETGHNDPRQEARKVGGTLFPERVAPLLRDTTL